MVVSDVHLLANELSGNNVYTKDVLTSDGRIQELDYEIVDALVKTVNEMKPYVLCITGDLSFNGAGESHRELARLLESIDGDTKVLVIPGNHDIYNLRTYTYKNDDPKQIKSIDENEFRQIYADFGYEGAYSYDADSLSYVWKLSDDTWLLMLDANLSKYNEDFDMNLSGGYLENTTLQWVEMILKQAKNQGARVISCTHQNLMTHNQLFTNGYTISNANELIELFKQYGVKINFSGHLHIQNIQEQDGLFDIASGGLLDYGNRYGILECYENGYKYSSEHIKMDEVNLEEISFEVFCSKYQNKGAVNRLSCELNAYYFDGNYKQIRELADNKTDDVVQIIESENAYLKEVLSVPDVNQDFLIVLD